MAKSPVNMVPMRKGHVCLHERVSYYTEANTNHQRQYRTYTVSIVESANVSGFALKVRDAASGAVREVGLCDKVYLAAGVTADAVRNLFANLRDADVESIAEAKAILRPLRAGAGLSSPCSQAIQGPRGGTAL